MLVLGRKPNEAVILSGGISFRILSIEGRQVKVGIEAPGHVRIMREELLPPAERSSPSPPGQGEKS